MRRTNAVASPSRVTLDQREDDAQPPISSAGGSKSTASRISEPSPSSEEEPERTVNSEPNGNTIFECDTQPDEIDEELKSNTDVEADEEAYERERQRRIEENRRLLESLGIAFTAPLASNSSLTTPSQQPTAKRKKREKDYRPVYDRSGYIMSAPGPGQRQRIACVEIPADRQLARRIAEGEYVDCTDWWGGEERRWRFGHGKGHLIEVEEGAVCGVTEAFRWRKWRGLEKELQKEMKARRKLNDRDKAGAEDLHLELGVSAYSLIPGEACHQCRRKSEKLKMRCRNVDPSCRALFCETCCKRYSYFDFDPDSRSFICPLCKDCCNCSNCIRKRKLSHILGPGRSGVRAKTINREGMTVQTWLEKTADDKAGIPFDRVRIVDQAYDVITPQLPPEEKDEPAVVRKTTKRKGRPTKEPKAKKSKDEVDPTTEKTSTDAIKIKLKLNLKQPLPSKVKEVDSDGDTVGGWSNEDEVRSPASSALTSLSASSNNDSATTHSQSFDRSTYSKDTNQYLATIAVRGPIRPSTLAAAELEASFAAKPVAKTQNNYTAYQGSRSTSPCETGSNPDTRRRRKPPPMANIVRAPKHSVLPAPREDTPVIAETPAETPLESSHSWASTSQQASQIAQTFSYDGYSNIPPAFSQLPDHTMMHGFPPPYSHSPSSQQRQWALDNPHIAYPSPPSLHCSHSAQSARPHLHQNHSHFFFERFPSNTLNQHHYEDHAAAKDTGRRYWAGDTDVEGLENGLSMGKAYHPGYP